MEGEYVVRMNILFAQLWRYNFLHPKSIEKRQQYDINYFCQFFSNAFKTYRHPMEVTKDLK